jgi:hypothetical protein
VVTLPSLAEGLPMAILEAMACARPVVATSVGGTPEAVLDGVTGLLVPVNDAEALGAAVIRLLRDPQLARSMGEAGRRRVEAHFTVERFLRAIEALYQDLTMRRPPSLKSPGLGHLSGRANPPADPVRDNHSSGGASAHVASSLRVLPLAAAMDSALTAIVEGGS